MVDLKQFREANSLLQKDVADYLGVSRAFYSLIETGRNGLPSKHLKQLLVNDRGWDVSMLKQSQAVVQTIGDGCHHNTQTAGGPDMAALAEKVSLLERLLDEKERLLEEKERTIQLLMNK